MEQRSQIVCIRGILSDVPSLLSGVPQGLSLGRLILYDVHTSSRKMVLTITCITITHNLIYQWILTVGYTSPFP